MCAFPTVVRHSRVITAVRSSSQAQRVGLGVAPTEMSPARFKLLG